MPAFPENFLRKSIPLLGGLGNPVMGLISGSAISLEHGAEISLTQSISLVGGFLEPLDGLGIILWNIPAMLIGHSQRVLGFRITSYGVSLSLADLLRRDSVGFGLHIAGIDCLRRRVLGGRCCFCDWSGWLRYG